MCVRVAVWGCVCVHEMAVGKQCETNFSFQRSLAIQKNISYREL